MPPVLLIKKKKKQTQFIERGDVFQKHTKNTRISKI